MLRSFTVLPMLALAACATDRYEWNLTDQQLSPKMQKMPQSDIREITRLVSERSPTPILCMHYTSSRGPYADEVWVVAADSYTMEESRNGLFCLKKQNGTWRIVSDGFGLSTSVIMCDDGQRI
jgi:hypothetical protein